MYIAKSEKMFSTFSKISFFFHRFSWKREWFRGSGGLLRIEDTLLYRFSSRRNSEVHFLIHKLFLEETIFEQKWWFCIGFNSKSLIWEPKMLIFHWFYKGLRKKSCCGCSGVGGGTTKLQREYTFFRQKPQDCSESIHFGRTLRRRILAARPSAFKGARTP